MQHLIRRLLSNKVIINSACVHPFRCSCCINRFFSSAASGLKRQPSINLFVICIDKSDPKSQLLKSLDSEIIAQRVKHFI